MKMELWCPVMWMILLCCSLMISHNHGIVEAAETFKNVKEFEIENKLKLINKPAVKIIKCIDGEEYGCVDFYKQPGFDNPSMKNHTFHYKVVNTKTFGHFWENGVGCPIGTVPMRRVIKDDFLKLESFGGGNFNPRGSWNNTYKPLSSDGGSHFAVVRTKGPKSYTGGSMNLAIYTPPVKTNQFSAGRMHIQLGNEFMQAGWIVNPQLYSDGRSRLYVYTNTGGQECYNHLCDSGMILVRQDFAPGLPLDDVPNYRIDLAITKDKANWNWFLIYNNEQIGFWPSQLFKESFGTEVEWGGEVGSYSLPSPPMGNGKFPSGDPRKDSHITLLEIVDGNYMTDKTVKNTETYSDNTNGYKVRDTTQSWFKGIGHILIYGGPGNV